MAMFINIHNTTLELWTLRRQCGRTRRVLLCLGAFPAQQQSSGFNSLLPTARPVGILEHDADHLHDNIIDNYDDMTIIHD